MPEFPTFADSQLPPRLQSRVEAELAREETLLWVGQPIPRRFILPSFFIMFFGIAFTGFAVFWIVMASSMMMAGPRFENDAAAAFGLFSCFPLFGIPFVLVGIGLLLAPLWAWRMAKSTCYAITDQRAIVWQTGWFGAVHVHSYRADALQTMRRIEYSDGSGSLIFDEHYSYGHRGRRHRHRYGFLAIDRVREIEELIRRTLHLHNDPSR